MRRGERRAVDAPEMFDEINDGRASAAGERLRLQRREGIKRALHRKQNCHYVHGVVRDCGGNHHGPKGEAFAVHVEERGKEGEVEKIRHVGELHEIVEHRAGEPREPERWMNSGEIEIELDEPAVEPAWIDCVDQALEFLEEENVK